jgi:hypothetical protein
MRSLIHKIKDRALTQGDVDTEPNMELLDTLLLNFVEDLILNGSINVPFVEHSGLGSTEVAIYERKIPTRLVSSA